MSTRKFAVIDGNEATAHVAYRVNEVCAIYPITPSSNMGEWADAWSAVGKKNIWGSVPSVVEMQSEGGAAGAVHGSLQAGALTTTFTASQGLLLMVPNMFKIAGELTSTVFHVTARCVATHALSIFGDHSDVMSTRSTGWGLLSSASVQEAMDFALIAQAATLEARVPFIHFFDGFRTSHEEMKVELLTDDDMRAMISNELVAAHRARCLSPDRPVLRGTAQNPDVFFQAREASAPYYVAAPAIVQKAMDQFAKIVGRQYKIYEYYGAPDAERVIIVMGSASETIHETVNALNASGEKVGVLKVRLYRPFAAETFVKALPASVKSIAVLDRTKEPGATGEPLYQDVITALMENPTILPAMPKVIGGRYGLSSKEFTPAMVKAIYDNMAAAQPKNHFTIGIKDDVSNSSLDFDANFSTEPASVVRALFYGLGSDGTVGANKNSIKIIGENTNNFAQGYYVYDSKKAGAVTVSHLRFGPEPIRSAYLIDRANFVACHQWFFVEKYDMVKNLVPGGVCLLNSPYSASEVWNHLPRNMQEQIIAKNIKLYTIDADSVAQASGMGRRINTTMQTCFFALSGVLPREEAIEEIKKAIKSSYGNKGEEIVRMNIAAVDKALENLFEVTPGPVNGFEMAPAVPEHAPEYVRNVLGTIIAGEGESLPVSAFAADGTFPTATTQYEKRNLALQIPEWDAEVCIQCGKCSIVCPHATIRMKAYEADTLANAPANFKSTDARAPEWKGKKWTLQVAPEDCTGCALCVEVCPAKNRQVAGKKAINMVAQPPIRMQERDNWDFFLSIPDMDRRQIDPTKIRTQQAQLPLFEFSGACAGCGETPYIKLLSQLFGDRAIVANATGCSSIYGGNLPTTPWSQNADKRGPAWSNSLFEDNAEFGLGIRLGVDKQGEMARELLQKLAGQVGENLAQEILNANQVDEAGIYDQRERVAALKEKLAGICGTSPEAQQLLNVAEYLVKKSVWILGGDGWAYDIGYGGLDHVLASGRNVNILVLDTEVYSNTGGQMSKSTPRGAVAKFAAGGKPAGKKDLGLMAMNYKTCYVASVALGSKDEHTLKAFIEAESFNGPSIIIAYSHCIAHGINMATAMADQKAAVDTGQWLLYRYDPRRAEQGQNPMQLDSKKPKLPVKDYLMMENRFKMLTKMKPEESKVLFEQAQNDVDTRFSFYEYLASRTMEPAKSE